MTGAPAPIRRSILVAEDESLLRMVAVDMFEKAGYHVIDVESGDEGAQALADGDENIVGLFTDVHMPGVIDGFALAKITHDLHPDAVILIVSGKAVPSPENMPADAIFMGKPYDEKAVLLLLDQLFKTNEAKS